MTLLSTSFLPAEVLYAYTKAMIESSLRIRLYSIISGVFHCPDPFYRSFVAHNAIIGGSVALRLLFGERCEDWSPRTLDLFVGCNEEIGRAHV